MKSNRACTWGLANGRLWRPLRKTAIVGGLLVFAAWAHADRETPRVRVAQSALSIGGIVKGIAGYTAWPNVRDTVVMCITRNGTDSGDIRYQIEHGAEPRALALMDIEPNQAIPADCNAVFFEGWSAEHRRAALRGLANKPVLSIGTGPDFCSEGGLFCIETRPEGTHFEVNLDAVARSGLRIHAQVLRLARQPAGAT